MPDGDSPERPLSRAAALARTELISTAPEALLLCPECAASLSVADFETHLRLAHHLFIFRGVRRNYNDTLTAILGALAPPRPDPEAWLALATLMREEHGPLADSYLAAALGRSLARAPDDRRAAAVVALAGILAQYGSTGLTSALASDAEVAARWLGLAVMGRLTPPLDPALHQPLQILLLDRRLPVEAQLAAVGVLVRSVGGDGPLAAESLGRLTSGLSKQRAIERLRQLERLIGAAPAIETLCAELEERLRMSCPRCPVELRRPDMMRHLWDEHRLILDGRRVREPWPVFEEWVEAARERDEPELLERCRTMAQQADPERGLQRLQRLVLKGGAADDEARRGLLAEAQREHASLCPWCYALVHQPREAPPLELTLGPDRLSAGGYGIDLSDKGFRTRLDVRTPSRTLHHGPEPRRPWTARGATVLLVGPLVLLALALAFLPKGWALPATAVLLLAAGAAWLTVRLLWNARPEPDRMLRCAWELLAPRLHEDGFRMEDSAFLAGLARRTPAGAFRGRRAPLLAALTNRTEQAVSAGQAPPSHLAALRRLLVEDAAAAGADPVPLVADLLARCFDGRAPLAFAEHLLTRWRSAWWTRGNLARLRVLLCDRAFESGFEVHNLIDAGQSAPALGEVLGIDDARGLAALRLLWARRPTRPWDHCGPSRSVFDLAAEAKSAELLEGQPDLLLWQEEPGWRVAADGGEQPMRGAEIRVCVGGVWLQDARFTEPPRDVELLRKSMGCELVLGARRFRSPDDLDGLARRMERWFRYYFQEFRPEAAQVQTWQSPDRSAILRAWGAAPCPECKRFLLARVGQVAVALDEAATRE